MNSNPNRIKPSIYIVDDDVSIGKSLVELLVLDGYNAEAFTAARAFLSSVPSDAKGCVISDIYMPEVDGFEFQKMMRQLGYRMPVIFISAHAKAGDREMALERGAAGFLLKPFDEKFLLEVIQKAVRD